MLETVLFICEHGSAKSVVAAAHFNRLSADRALPFRAVSRGTSPDAVNHPVAVSGLQADELVPQARPCQLSVADLEKAVRVVSFGDLPAEYAARAPVEVWTVPPVSEDYAVSRSAIVNHVEGLLADLARRTPSERAMDEERRKESLLIAFVDLTRFAAQSERVDDHELAGTLDAYYEHLGAAVRTAGGSLVKVIGDAALIVFPETAVDEGVATILALKESVDHLMTDRGWECRLTAKVHFGKAIAGPFGAAGEKRFDVLGRAVNTAAMLHTTGVTLSAEAYRRLGEDLRRRFVEHALPVTYILAEDPRRFRWKPRT